MRTSLLTRIASMLGLLLAAACAGGANLAPSARPTSVYATLAKLRSPALISIDLTTGALVYWAIDKGPSQKPIAFTASLSIYEGYSMAANGDIVVIANYLPPEIVLYNVKTKTTQTLADSYGNPLDVALDGSGNIYAMNADTVEAFKFGSQQEQYELSCPYISKAVAIAADRYGDVFVNGYGPSGFMGVIEYPPGSSGPESCITTHLRPERGYPAGVGVDPKTNDLIVVDNPGECAGGFEGRMIVYPSPYRRRRSHQYNLHARYCAGTFRLDATSQHIYVSDSTGDNGAPLIDLRSYPDGRGSRAYGASGTDFGGFTTIPNALPN